MKLVSFLVYLVIILLLLSCTTSQNDKKSVKIGIINISTGLEEFVEGFKEGLAENGYIEGRNVTFFYSGAIAKKDIIAEVNKLKGKDIDLLYTMTTPVTKNAKKILKGTGIPIVFAPVFSPVDAGITKTDPAENHNITGVKVRGSTQKALEMLLAIVPEVKNVFVPYHVTDKAAQLTMEDLKTAAAKLDVNLLVANLETVTELDRVLQEIPPSADALYMSHSHLILSHANQIITAATAKKIPVVSSASHYKNGVLVSYSIEYSKMGKQASRLAVKVLNGIDTTVLPIETGEYFLGMNLITAEEIGIKIPYDILAQADFIVRKPLENLD